MDLGPEFGTWIWDLVLGLDLGLTIFSWHCGNNGIMVDDDATNLMIGASLIMTSFARRKVRIKSTKVEVLFFNMIVMQPHIYLKHHKTNILLLHKNRKLPRRFDSEIWFDLV